MYKPNCSDFFLLLAPKMWCLWLPSNRSVAYRCDSGIMLRSNALPIFFTAIRTIIKNDFMRLSKYHYKRNCFCTIRANNNLFSIINYPLTVFALNKFYFVNHYSHPTMPSSSQVLRVLPSQCLTVLLPVQFHQSALPSLLCQGYVFP